MQLRNGKQIRFISKEKKPVVVEKPIDPEKEKIRVVKKEIYIISEKFFNSNEKYEELRKNPDAGQSCREAASSLTLDGRDLVFKLHKVFNDPVLAKGMRYYWPLDTQECHIILMRALYILDKLRERNLKDGPTVLYYYTLFYYLDETLKVCKELLKSFGLHILWR